MGSVKLKSISTDQTLRLGQQIGAKLKGGEVIELVSDLGGGKTTLVKGLAKGSGSKELVSSPSFTICNEYLSPKFKLYHFDFYRLNDPGIIRRELAEVIAEPGSVIVIEWPEVVENSLPKERLIIRLKVVEENMRAVRIDYPKQLAYLVKDLK